MEPTQEKNHELHKLYVDCKTLAANILWVSSLAGIGFSVNEIMKENLLIDKIFLLLAIISLSFLIISTFITHNTINAEYIKKIILSEKTQKLEEKAKKIDILNIRIFTFSFILILIYIIRHSFFV